MKNLLIFLTLCCPIILSAQKTITWKGGTPGKKSAWTEPKNWDANKVPTEDDKVIIANQNIGLLSYPLISEIVQIASIEIHSDAILHVSKSGKLIVDGEYVYSRGISILKKN